MPNLVQQPKVCHDPDLCVPCAVFCGGSPNVRVADSFFRLPGNAPDIDQDEFICLAKAGAKISNKIYRPDVLRSPRAPQRWRIKDCHFTEISFSKTLIEGLEFENCKFSSCLFIGSVIRNCRFTDCSFKRCNTYRIEFSGVYINPQSFDECLDESKYQNIGVHLYQELLSNSRQLSQPDFIHHALFEFRRWLRLEQLYELKQEGVDAATRIRLIRLVAQSWLAQLLLGFGVRLRSYFLTAASATFFFAIVNHSFAKEFGLGISSDFPQSFADAFYFTIITLTTIGYGDITPTTAIGRIVVAGEGIVGFVLFATFASMIYRKILP
jgi:hypothetical protein